MKSILKKDRILVFIALLGLLASLAPLAARTKAEQSNRYYDYILDYSSLRYMASLRNFQAILPIRGKILNVEKASIDKVLANAEIKTMINAFGCGFSEGYGNDFDITKLRYDKIIKQY